MQLIAKGKWSKQMKRWTMVVALHRPAAEGPKRPQPGKRTDRPRPR